MKLKKTLFLLILSSVGLFWACNEEENSNLENELKNTIELKLIQNTINGNSAELTCNISNLGNYIVSKYGLCWNTTGDPTVNDLKTENVTLSNLNFNNKIESLNPSSSYFVKAYVIIEGIVIYSDQLELNTTIGLPILSTMDISNIMAFSASSGGTITDNGGSAISARGICYSKSPTPTIEDKKTINGTGTGSFISNLEYLSNNTTYYVRAYASNGNGTSYGNQISFKTKSGTVIITTTTISDITYNFAKSGGNITDDGGRTIVEKGVIWSTSPDPYVGTVGEEFISRFEGANYEYESYLTDLYYNTKYYVKAYAKTSTGWVEYGNELNFTTTNGYATVTTDEITNITSNTATGGGNITDEGELTVSSRGICWSTNPNPTIIDNSFTDTEIGGGDFSLEMIGLDGNTTYYVRAWANNGIGTAYGNEVTFTTNQVLSVTDYDGNVYEAVQIGDQIWMAENLRTTHFADGTPIALIESGTQWSELSYNETAMCYYEYPSTYPSIYGALYTWSAAMNGSIGSNSNPSNLQGACPDGWHLPSDEEWKALEIYLGMSQSEADDFGYRGTYEGSKLINTDSWLYQTIRNYSYAGISGFLALPAGYRNIDGRFYDSMGDVTYFWSATENNSQVWCRRLEGDSRTIHRYYYSKNFGYSIRCVQD